MIILGSPFMFGVPNLIDTITSLGLTSGLKLCLDAGDAISYTSGQTWADRSGNGYDFVRGTTSASQATDPTFNGSAGGKSSSEYWSFDGGDYFTLGQANPTWINNIHKNNAQFTLACWVYLGSSGTGVFCGDYIATGSPMFNWYASSLTKLSIAVSDGSSFVFDQTMSATISTGVWTFVAVTLNEAANTMTLQVDGTQETFACTYSGPSASNAGNILKIGADGDGAFPLVSGSRLHSFMAWEGTALSAAQILSLYDATKLRFGH
jgi:hypothetical protein